MSELAVGPYVLAVFPAAGGPVVTSGDSALEPLVMLLNQVRPGDEIFDGIRRRRQASTTVLEVTGDDSIAQVWSLGVEQTVPVRWSDLAAAVDRLAAQRADWSPPRGPWLFTDRPISPMPSVEDLDIMRRLSQEADAIDAADLEAEVGAEPATLMRRRRTFLADCEAVSLLDAHTFVAGGSDARTGALRSFGSRSLLDLHEAALRLRGWDLGPAAGAADSVLTIPVCLDFVRLELWPPGEDGQEWARRATALLDPDESGDQGMVLEHVGGEMVRVYWRRDAERPAVLAVALGAG